MVGSDEHFEDFLQHAIRIISEFVIVETEHDIPFGPEKFIALTVIPLHVRQLMVSTIKLDNQLSCMTAIIDNVWSYWHLPLELKTMKSMSAKIGP